MKSATQAIGIFDSGLGGLTVAHALQIALPNEHFIYVGDTKHMPYGEKTAQEIISYSEKIVEFLISKNVKLIVIACNSASAVAASYLRNKYWQQVEIIGVIRPIIKSILKQNIKKIGLIATQATVNSNIYAHILEEYQANIALFQLATPKLAFMIEHGLSESLEMQELLNTYLSNKNFEDKEAILLACTHYPLIKDKVNNFFGGKKLILDNAQALVLEITKYLIDKNLLSEKKTISNIFFVSKFSENFEKVAAQFYGEKINVQFLE